MSTGRPRLLTDETLAEICSLVAAGLPLRTVVRHVGCHIRTVRREQQRDEAFRRALSEAELAARLEPEKLLRKAAAHHWRAAAWLIERTQRRGGRSAPSAVLPEGLQALSDAMIEYMLAQLENRDQRRAAFDDLSAVAALAIRDILTGGPQTLRRRISTPHIDAIRLDLELESYSPSRWKSDAACLPGYPRDFAGSELNGAQRAAPEDKTRATPAAVNLAAPEKNTAGPPRARRSAA